MVRSCKRVFYSIRGNRRMTDETLSTSISLVEQALHNRPLTPVSDDLNELEALAPSHFLLGRPFQALPSLVPGDEPDIRRRYTKAQAYANPIWVRWMKEYVPSLHKPGKWNKHSDVSLKAPPCVGCRLCKPTRLVSTRSHNLVALWGRFRIPLRQVTNFYWLTCSPAGQICSCLRATIFVAGRRMLLANIISK